MWGWSCEVSVRLSEEEKRATFARTVKTCTAVIVYDVGILELFK